MRWHRRAALVSAVLFAATIAAIPAAASHIDEQPGVLLLVDGSGSMNRIDDSGRALLEGAWEASERIIATAPPTAASTSTTVPGAASGSSGIGTGGIVVTLLVVGLGLGVTWWLQRE